MRELPHGQKSNTTWWTVMRTAAILRTLNMANVQSFM